MENGDGDGVTLVPFEHQVGGHTGMMIYDEATVCKPVSPAELHFYETLTPEIAQFTPGFKGVVHVSVQEEEDGSFSVRAYPVRAQRQTTSPRIPSNSVQAGVPDPSGKRSQKQNLHRNSKWKHPQRSRALHAKEASGSEDLFEDHSESKTTHHGFNKANPWGVHLNRLQVARMHEDQSTGNPRKFILLENLTSRFNSPCILDIKLGTRTYHKDHSEEKRQMHIDRDTATTTASLGLRLCGMQVYQPSKGCYKCRNKYDGRRLAKDGLKRTLGEFFSTHSGLRLELIPPFIQKLTTLIRAVSSATTLRLLSSSLLLIYEGDLDQSRKCLQGTGDGEESPASVVDLRIIDFANSETDTDAFRGDGDKCGNDGCVYGLKNLVEILKDIQGTNLL